MKKILISGIILLLLVFTACSKKADAPKIAEAPANEIQVHETEKQIPPVKRELNLAGRINGNLGIHMKLSIQGNGISGTYYYDNIKTNLQLKGSIDDKKNMTMNEFDNKGNTTGIFKGKFVSDNKIQGDWTKPNGSGVVSFVVEEVKGGEPAKISEDVSFKNWNGKWSMGNSGGPGASAGLSIKNADKKQFEFSIDAAYVSTVTNEKGEKFLNPHMGGTSGVAYFTSSKQAYFTTKELQNYKMIFDMVENKIVIKEINTKTGDDYASSPGAGINVRYFGTYIKK